MFENPEPVRLNQRWLHELAGSANSTAGITLAAEHLITTAETADSAGSSVSGDLEVHA